VASSAPAPKDNENDAKPADERTGPEQEDEDEFSSKAQVMTLMTTDVDRVGEFSWHLFSLVNAPLEVVVGSVSVDYVPLRLRLRRRRSSCTTCSACLHSSGCSLLACSFPSTTLRARSLSTPRMVGGLVSTLRNVD
jgi:hypothetical protein